VNPYPQQPPQLHPAQLWVIATGVILHKRDDKRLDILGGEPRPSGAREAFFHLMRGWGVLTPSEANERIEWLLEKGHRVGWEAQGVGPAAAFMGWDAVRAATVAGWAYRAYLIDKQTAWQFHLKVAELLRATYRTWAEVGQSYVHGLNVWSDGDSEIVAPTAAAVGWLTSHPASPWVQLPWETDLSAATLPPDPPAYEVRVGPGGHAPTISDGIRMAGPNGRVIVASGTYREQINPEHSVEVIAEGPVTLESAFKPCVRAAEQRTVVVRGFTLRATQTETGESLNAVHCVNGFARLEQCDISATNDGVQLRDWAIAHVFDSRIQGCGKYGVGTIAGRCVILRTEISQCGKDGVMLKNKGPNRIEGGKLHGNGGAGAYVADGVDCTIRGVEISGNTGPAEIVGIGESELTIEDVKISNGRSGGIFFQDSAQGSLGGVSISGCALAALDIGTTSFINGEDVALVDNKSSGVLVRANGRLLLVRSTLTNNVEGHLWIMNGGRAALAECHVAGGKTGLWVQGGAMAYAYRTAFEGQTGTALDAQPGGRLVASKCKVTGAGGDAIVANAGADVRLVFAEVGGAGGAGLRALDGAAVRVEDSILEGSRGGDLVGRAEVIASRISGQAGGSPGVGAPEERRKAADQAFDDALSAIVSGEG